MFTVSPLTVNAQAADDADSTVVKKKVHVAFRDKDPDHLLGGISYVDMEELQKKDYMTSSLEDMYALVGGWNGNNLWVWTMTVLTIMTTATCRSSSSTV